MWKPDWLYENMPLLYVLIGVLCIWMLGPSFATVLSLLALATASVLTAPLGAWLAHRMNVAQLRRVFALLLYVVGAAMLYRG